MKNGNKDDIGFYHKDRYFSVKIRPVKEDKWWPGIAVGSNDPVTTDNNAHETGLPEKTRIRYSEMFMLPPPNILT